MPAPELSAILATDGDFSCIRTTFRHLQRQTAAARMEVIVVAPEVEGFGLDPAETECFAAFRFVAVGARLSIVEANARGVQQATAPIVVLCEDHSFPRQNWAETLLARHREDWVAVAPVVRNANPRTAVSWADYLLGYGPWRDGSPAGPREMLPGHNCSYKRAVLLDLGEGLAEWLKAESLLHEKLHREGARLYLENETAVSHLNFARISALLPLHFWNGRQYASIRAREWSRSHALAFALASPLVPLVRFARIWRSGSALPRRPSPLAVYAIVMLALISDAAGQAAGCLLGEGRTSEVIASMEYRRVRFIQPDEAAALE